jgi:hypothetical protein
MQKGNVANAEYKYPRLRKRLSSKLVIVVATNRSSDRESSARQVAEMILAGIDSKYDPLLHLS